MKPLTSRVINRLRIALVILVLFVHIHPDHNPHWLTMDNLSGQPLGWVIFSVVGTFFTKFAFIAVPLFFAISGYLFFQRLESWSWQVWRQKMQSRVKALFVPYLIFNSICAISLLYLSLKARNGLSLDGAYNDRIPFIGYLWNGVSYCQGWENWLGMDMQLYYPLDVPLWFVRDLMVMLVISPAIHWLIRKGGVIYLGIVGIAYWFGILCCTPGFSTNALFFFSLGAFAAIRSIDPIEWSRKSIKWTLLLFIILWIVASFIVKPGNAQPFENLMFTVGIPVCFWICAAVRDGKSDLSFLTGACFFVYCIHMVNFGSWNLLSWVSEIGKLFNLNSPIIATFVYLTEIVTIIIIGTSTYYLLKKFTPWLCQVLTGGRQ